MSSIFALFCPLLPCRSGLEGDILANSTKSMLGKVKRDFSGVAMSHQEIYFRVAIPLWEPDFGYGVAFSRNPAMKIGIIVILAFPAFVVNPKTLLLFK